MAQGSMQMAAVSGDPMAKLTDDILADIIPRVSYKSTCCCKCVSTRWRDLISHPYHRKKMPQSLIGFFYESYDPSRLHYSFTNVSGKVDPLVDPSLSFLPRFEMLTIIDCCNGLLLCSFYRQNDPDKSDYVVCNPATEKWVVVPGTDWSSEAGVRLAFDPAVSSHFHVCELVDEELWFNEDDIGLNECIAAVVIYSSKTGVWSHNADAWSGYDIETHPMSKSVLFRGVLYLCAFDHKLVALDVEENNWKVIPLPVPECRGDNPHYDINLSQGQLYFAHKGDSELSIWVLEDPSRENWTLKHNVSHLQMFGTEYSAYAAGYSVFSIHPEHSLIFLVCRYEETLMSYDMDSRELRILCHLGRDGEIHWSKLHYLPYVPLYSALLAVGH
ncbi:unnamed protein product [Alopecurus aequalis]